MKPAQNPRGGALISALIAVVIISAMSLGLTQLTMTGNGVSLDTQDRYNALLLAESGMAIAFQTKIDNNIATQPDFEGPDLEVNGTEPGILYYRKINEHTEIVVVKRPGPNGPNTFPVVIEASGKVEKRIVLGNVTRCYRTLQAVVDVKNANGSFFGGAFGLVGLALTGTFMTDSYDSAAGSYANTKGTQGDVGTNGAIDLGHSAALDINGNVYVGPGQAAWTPKGGALNGQSLVLPSPIKVAIAPYNPPIPLRSSIPNSLEAGSYHVSKLYGDFVVASGTVNIYVDGDIDLDDVKLADGTCKLNIWQGSGSIKINGGGQLNTAVTVHHDATQVPAGTVVSDPIVRTVNYGQDGVTSVSQAFLSGSDTYTTQMNKKAVLGWIITTPAFATLSRAYIIPAWDETEPGIPSNFNVISNTTGDVHINGHADFYGTVLCPYAHVEINGNSNTYGAVLGSYVFLSGTGDFHNDTSARSPGFVSLPIVCSYCEIPAVVPPAD